MTDHQIYLTSCVVLKGGRYTKEDLPKIFHEMGQLSINVKTRLNHGYIKHWLSDEVIMTMCPFAMEFKEANKRLPNIETKKVLDQFDVCIREIQKLEKML